MNIFNSVARELKYLSFSIKLLMRAGRVDKYRSETVADLIEKQIKKYPTNVAIEFEDRIRINAIEPAAIDTPMLRSGLNKDSFKKLELY